MIDWLDLYELVMVIIYIFMKIVNFWLYMYSVLKKLLNRCLVYEICVYGKS